MSAVTIDGVGSKDLDDAIWCTRRDGGYLIQVLVSNVAEKIPLLSEWDERARTKQFSVYSGGRGCVSPMLPRFMSEDKLSLTEGKSRDVVVYEIDLDDKLNVSAVTITTSAFLNNNRLDPEAILGILKDKEHPLHSQVSLMGELATKLLNKRRADGSLAIYDIFSGWACDEDGAIRKLSDAEKNIGYVIVQEFMVLTNSVVSQYCLQNNIPIMYRNHQVNIAAPAIVDLSNEIQHAFTAQDARLIGLLSKRLALFAGKAVMGEKVYGHYGLNLPVYAYFTSPIRRYPDLVNQRNILAYLRGQPYPHDERNIAELASMYNNRITQVQQETADHHAKKARDKGEGNLELQRFHSLDGKELHQAIKVFIGRGDEQAPKSLQDDVVRRITTDSIEHKTLALLFSCGFAGFEQVEKCSVVTELKSKPYLATSICNILVQKFGMHELEYEYQECGPDNNRTFECKASTSFKDSVILSASQFSGVKKTAGQFAALDILQKLIGVVSVISERPLDKAADAKVVSKAAQPDVRLDNPVGALQELCQKNKYSMPVYEHERTGPDHMPSFSATVTVVVNGNELSGICKGAASKKEAAKSAATNWLHDHHLINKFNSR